VYCVACDHVKNPHDIQATARGLISPSNASGHGYRGINGTNARVEGATQDFIGLIGGHVGQARSQYSLRFPPTLFSSFLSLIPTLLTLTQPHKRTHQSG
jgi:hypothetical protein